MLKAELQKQFFNSIFLEFKKFKKNLENLGIFQIFENFVKFFGIFLTLIKGDNLEEANEELLITLQGKVIYVLPKLKYFSPF